MANLSNLNPILLDLHTKFLEQYPNIRTTSGFRDASHNKKVGGAKGSAHIDGSALDMSLRGLDEAQKAEVVQWWRDRGAKGIGYYPNSDSIHVDIREGANRAWGPNYSRTSLGQTPQWFQDIASTHLNTPAVAPDTAVAATPAPTPRTVREFAAQGDPLMQVASAGSLKGVIPGTQPPQKIGFGALNPAPQVIQSPGILGMGPQGLQVGNMQAGMPEQPLKIEPVGAAGMAIGDSFTPSGGILEGVMGLLAGLGGGGASGQSQELQTNHASTHAAMLKRSGSNVSRQAQAQEAQARAQKDMMALANATPLASPLPILSRFS